ncbi:MAG: alkaline phosphatase [Deltaproteobacteria bacterium]|nr:alkaline phosphatase [Deltaproteobacteria bacterium]
MSLTSKNIPQITCFAVIGFLLSICVYQSLASAQMGPRMSPQNIIFIVGDGMGSEQIKAARLSKGASLSFEKFAYVGDVVTSSVSGVTDSAAAATAMARAE